MSTIYDGLSFSHELRARRTKKNLSLREASGACGISRSTLSRLERGIGLMEMSAEKTAVLASFFRWDLKEMMRKMQAEAKGETCESK